MKSDFPLFSYPIDERIECALCHYIKIELSGVSYNLQKIAWHPEYFKYLA